MSMARTAPAYVTPPGGRLAGVSNRPPFTLTLAAVLEAVVGLLALGGGLFTLVETVVGEPKNLATALAVAALAVGGGALMLKVALGLYRAEGWSRSPAVVTQLFLLPVAVTLVQSDRPWLGYPLAALGVCALLMLLSGPTAAALYPGEDEDEKEGRPR
jgi:peptidoglycan/LPS O-acetylase OafA/YrhL